jgi:EmrB/QacA subfamily drug resistance transporter
MNKQWFFCFKLNSTHLSFASILCAIVLNYLDQSILPVALPAIADEFGANSTLIQWAVNGYILLFACLVLLGGKIGNAIGPKKGFLIGIILFAFFSVMCGFSPNISWLIWSRTLQALGASLMFPAQAAILSQLFPVHQQGRATGFLISLGMVVGFLGPFIGGLLTQVFSWRAIFWINIPISLFGFLLGYFSLPHIEPIKQPIDWKGFAYFVLTICPITILLMQINDSSMPPLLEKKLPFIACGLISLIFLVRRTLTNENPFFDFRLLKYRKYSAILFSVCITKFIMMISIFQTIYCETILNYTQIETGLLFSSSFAPTLLFSFIGGYLTDKISPRLPISIGYLLVLFSLFWLAFHSTPSLFDLLLSLVIYGVGLPLILTPSNSLLLSCIPKDKVSIGTGMVVTLRMTAASLGLALIHLFTTAVQRIETPILGTQGAMVKSFSNVHLALALLFTFAFVVTFLLHGKPWPKEAVRLPALGQK